MRRTKVSYGRKFVARVAKSQPLPRNCRATTVRKPENEREIVTLRPLLVLVGLTLGLAACNDWPEIEVPGSAQSQAASWPRLLPLAPILTRADATVPDEGPSAARIASLEARAGVIRRPVIDPQTRKDMEVGVDLSGLYDDALN